MEEVFTIMRRFVRTGASEVSDRILKAPVLFEGGFGIT